MNKTRFLKCLAGTLAATAVLIGSVSAPAQARDTGWDKVGITTTKTGPNYMNDTGWDKP